jgi:hypothetical protein
MKSALSISRTQKLRYLLPMAIGLLSLAMANPALAEQDRMLRTVTVTGVGTENVATTITRAQLGVEVQGNTAEEAQREAARRSTAVVDFLRSRNVEKLQTTGIYLSPRYDFSENGEQKIVGYTATNSVSFQILTEQAGTLLDEAVRAGATRIDGVSFIADDAALSNAQNQAIREAIQNAQSQADAALETLGLSRGEVVSIQVNGAAAPPPVPLPMAAMESRAADTTPTPVIGGEQEVQASVTLQISY